MLPRTDEDFDAALDEFDRVFRRIPVASRNVRHEQPIGHTLLEVPDHHRLSSRYRFDTMPSNPSFAGVTENGRAVALDMVIEPNAMANPSPAVALHARGSSSEIHPRGQ
jgi:hypothetical protein